MPERADNARRGGGGTRGRGSEPPTIPTLEEIATILAEVARGFERDALDALPTRSLLVGHAQEARRLRELRAGEGTRGEVEARVGRLRAVLASRGIEAGPGDDDAAVPTVLVVEDDLDARFILSTRLEREGWKVTTVGDGYEALRCLDRARYALVCLDFWLPRFNGAEVLAYMHALGDVPPVLVMSAVPQGAAHPGVCRADQYFPKPYDVDEVVRVARKLLARARNAERPSGRSGTWSMGEQPGKREK